jgi:branched-chain amino acid transport system substrate-binding protein
MDVAAKYKIPHLFAMAAPQIINEKYHSDPQKYCYWHAKLWPIPALQAQGFVDCLNNAVKTSLWKPDKKVVAVYGEDSDWGRSTGEGFRRIFGETGWKISSEDYFGRTQIDFYPLMSKYKSAGVSVIAGTSNQPDQISAFVKQADEVGVKAVMIAYGLGWIGGWYDMTGRASDYVLDESPQLLTDEAKKWAKEFEKKYGNMPGAASGGIPYDGANFFIKVLQRTLEKYGELSRETIHKVALEEVDTGKLTYSAADGALINKGYRYTKETIPDPVYGMDAYYFPVFQYMEGKDYIVFPDEWKVRDFAPPKK